jgi:hypothetical protein
MPLKVAAMYLRFVVGSESADGRWLTGAVTETQSLVDKGQLDPFEATIIRSTFEWFNDQIPCPLFQKNLRTGKWSDDAVAWFLPTAHEAIQRMWDLVGVLRNHNVPVRVLRTTSPGLVVYRDEYQVVAETPKRGRRDC